MDIGLDHFNYIKTTFDYGVKMKSYHNSKTDDFFIFSSNGIHCVLKNRQYIYFYRDDKFIVKTNTRLSYVSRTSSKDQVIHYLELSIFLHANETVVDNLVQKLSQMKQSEDLTHMLHPKEMNYFFNFDYNKHPFDSGSNPKNDQVLMIKHDNEFYYSNNSFFRINESLSQFINEHTFCSIELYYSLETSKILFVHDLKWSVINFVYDRSSEALHIFCSPTEKYKDSPNALNESVPEISMCLPEAEMYEYVYNYLFNRSVEDLKPTMQEVFHDCGVTVDSDYKDTLKIVDMISI